MVDVGFGVKTVRIGDLHAAEDNLRRDVGNVDELVASIREQGILEPPIVTPNGDGYTIVAGARRVAAAAKAGLTDVVVIVREFDQAGRVEAMLVENLHRTDLTPLEEAEGYRRLVGLQLSQRDIAAKVGRSQAHVSKRLALLELPQGARDALDAGRITLEDAPELKRLADCPERIPEAIADMARYRSLAATVSVQLEEHAAAERKRKATERAKSEGIKLVGYPNGYSSTTRVLSKAKGGRLDAMPFSKAEHKKEPCHAAALSPSWDGNKFVYVCTEPTRHNAKGESSLKLPKDIAPPRSASQPRESKEERERRAAEAKELEGFATRRREWITKLVSNIRGRKISKEEISTTIASAYVLTWNDGDAVGYAAVALGIQSRNTYGMSPAIEKHVAASPGNLQRFAFACALFAGEAALVDIYADKLAIGWYVEFLKRHGYELSDVEHELAKGNRR